MYTIKLDGKTLYSPAVPSKAYKVMNPQLSLDINTSGSCTFVIPPGNHLHGAVRRRKSIITVHEGGQEIFRGRVLNDETDQYKQKSVYCEGVRSYLNDSQAAPYQYTGTPRGLLEKLIGEHNAQIELEKRFTIGKVTAERAGEALTCENVAYWETFREIDEKLLGAYGGYLRARQEGGVQYIDWVQEYSGTSSQEIRFAVNLIDIKDKNDAADVFTILRPLGASSISDEGEQNAPVTISSVNGGKDYIQDDEAIARYGRIWKTQTWAHIEDPAKLMDKAQEYMKIGAELRTITLRAIDMHFLSGSAQAIRVGDKVHIVSQPHGIDLEKVCCKIDIDLANPENTTYTFGEPLKALTDNFVKAEEEIDSVTGFKGGGGGRGNVKQEMNGILRWAKISVDQANANINLNAGEVNSLKNRMSTAEINIDGINAQIVLKADAETVDELGMRMTQAEIEIDGANAEIVLKASKTEVNDLGKRVSSAEIEIDGLNSEIRLKADKVTIDAELTTIKKYFAGSATAAKMTVTNLTAVSATIGGNKCEWKSKSFMTDKSSLTVTSTGGTVTGVTLNKRTDTIYYMGWA